jgi:hypothetical protein
MNIFVLHRDPVKAAQMYCNKHVGGKMQVELAQQLSCAHHIHNSKYKDIVYKKTHINHPCSIWVRATSSNYDWAYRHFVALCDEYTFRYGKIHLTQQKLLEVLRNNPCPCGELTPFAQAMPEGYYHADAVVAYRNYYNNVKQKLLQYTKREQPSWIYTQ